jgi:hypothetical protein
MIEGPGSGSVPLTNRSGRSKNIGSYRSGSAKVPLTATQDARKSLQVLYSNWDLSRLVELLPGPPNRSVLFFIRCFLSHLKSEILMSMLSSWSRQRYRYFQKWLISIKNRLSVTFLSKFHNTVLINVSQRSKNTYNFNEMETTGTRAVVTIHQFYPLSWDQTVSWSVLDPDLMVTVDSDPNTGKPKWTQKR